MAKMARNNVKSGIDRVARGARRAADALGDAHDKNKRPGARVGSKVKAAVDRVGDKVKQAAGVARGRGSRAKLRARRAAR